MMIKSEGINDRKRPVPPHPNELISADCVHQVNDTIKATEVMIESMIQLWSSHTTLAFLVIASRSSLSEHTFRENSFHHLYSYREAEEET